MTAPLTVEHSDSETITSVVSAAARAAAALVPATTELVPGAPVSDPEAAPLPPAAAKRLTLRSAMRTPVRPARALRQACSDWSRVVRSISPAP